MPKVSVIIPAFNPDIGYLLETLESVWEQTFRNFEVIIVDDGSTNGFVKDLPRKSNLKIIQQENKGQPRARRVAVEASSGEYIALVDADDLWLPEKLTSQVAFLDAEPDLDFIFTDFFNFDSKGISDSSYFADRFTSRKSHSIPVSTNRKWYRLSRDALGSYLDGNYILQSTILARRKSWLQKNMFLSPCIPREGYEYLVRSMHRLSIGFIDEPLVNRRLHDSNISTNQETFLLNTIHIGEKAQKYPWVGDENKHWLKNSANKARFSLARDYFFRSNHAKAREHLRHLWKEEQASWRIFVLYMFTLLFPGKMISLARTLKRLIIHQKDKLGV
ncbi:glycosyltransferase family 2 protein [Desulfonatronovibrio hydrogenovorans]|uniref:glycosyltransferase family 2 protein n=1 Tax=Desulfonatronovibrio hydrogenovorans TaxID=53245 RepID=UPI001377B2F6|nr:glycosyltransferase family A protein [Desulfonatronovibrio hydrogenovorans]